jgi:predicted membrane-bound spermidine synthase
LSSETTGIWDNKQEGRNRIIKKEVIKANMVVFIASFCTLVIELVAGRIMAPYVGVSLYTWTSIIGVVLAGISIGAYLGGWIADRYPRPATLGWLLFLSGVGALTIAPLTNLIGAAQFNTSLMLRILIITSAIFFVPSCILGMISPVVVKLTLKNLNHTGNIVGKIYAFSTLGSILGTFATGFFLISLMGTRNILLTMGVILIVSALVFGEFFRKKRGMALFTVIFASFLWAFYGYAFKPQLDKHTYFYKESNYYTLKLSKTQSSHGDSPVEALIIDNLTHSYTDLNDPFHLEYSYLKIFDEFLTWSNIGSRPAKMLFVGGGGYTFPRYIEKKYPAVEMDVVEIDPEITRIAYQYLGLPGDTRIRSFNEDARWFVMNQTQREVYDFIFLDAFNDLSIPYHLTTKEFAAQMKPLLKKDGMILANLIDDVQKGQFLPSYIKTLEEVFGKGLVKVVIPFSGSKPAGISTCIVAAGSHKMDMDDFVKKIKAIKGEHMVSSMLPPDLLQLDTGKRYAVILTDDYVPVDNLIAPIFEERFGYRK